MHPDCKILWTPASPETLERDRAAAEWVLATGPFLVIVNGSDSGTLVKTVAELPFELFSVNQVNLRGVKSLDVADLDCLIGLPRLRGIVLDETNIDSSSIPILAKMRSLDSLGLSGTRIQSSELVGLASLRILHGIHLKAGRQIDDGWAGLDALSSLRKSSCTDKSRQTTFVALAR